MNLSLSNQELHFLVVVCCCIFLFGGIGGIAGGLYRYKCGHFPCISRWRDLLFIFPLSGMVCAFGVVVLCSGIGSIFDRSNLFSLGLYVIGLSLVSGFFSMRIIPCLGNRLEEQINAVNKRAIAAEKQGKIAMEYNQLISIATTALSTKNMPDIDYAIECLSHSISNYYWDRTLNIYLGRLYRAKGDLNQAILCLRKFIDEMYKHQKDKTPVEKEALAVAYFNIACYHSLKIATSPIEKDRLLHETEDALQKSFDLMPMLKADALSDDDLSDFRASNPKILEK